MLVAKPEKRRYMPGIDGLRAIAVIGVVIYHLNSYYLPGGFLGVTVFFVLSGYLITDLIIEEWNQRGKMNYLRFMVRRFRRLAPALLTLLFFVTTWVTFMNHSTFEKVKSDLLPSLLYVSNWWYIFHETSYFETFGAPSPFTHIWSLAIEEQFYVIWPILVIVCFLQFKKQSTRMVVILAAAILSACLMAFLYIPGSDPTRVYYGTDTRAFSLLLGAVLAFIWPSQRLSKTLPKQASLVLEIVGGASLLFMVWMFFVISQYDDFLYRGGMFLLSLLTVFAVAALAHPASIASKWLSIKPLRWIGVRSYGIYLWHYPIIILTTPVVNTDGVNPVRIILQIVATLVVSAISYRWIESPVRAGKLKNVWGILFFRRKSKSKRNQAVVFAGMLVFVVAISVVGSAFVSKANHVTSEPQPAVAQPLPEAAFDKEPLPYIPVTEASPSQDPKTEDKEEGTPPAESTEKSITIIGDSLIHDVIPFFKKVYPNAIIDYRIGRQMAELPEVMKQLGEKGQLGEYVIIQTGTNGPFKQSDLLTVIEELGIRKVFLVNCRVPRPWESTVNSTLEEIVKSRSHLILIDWYSASAGHAEYFVSDGVHLSKLGGEAYSNLLVEHLEK